LVRADSRFRSIKDKLRLGDMVIDFRRLEAYCGARRVELTDESSRSCTVSPNGPAAW
jgi:hypothetical protein